MAVIPALSPALRQALEPFLSGKIGWTLHFPMYVNTYCFAHHLAAGLNDKGKRSEQIDRHFVLEESWRGLPQFTYRTDIEIFVGVDEIISNLRECGHSRLEQVLFTKYCQQKAFIRTKSGVEFSECDPLLITDIEPSAKIMRENWESSPPAWLSKYAGGSCKNWKILRSSDRSIGSLLQSRKKIYLFGAPMTQIMMAQAGDGLKYEEIQTNTPAIPTYYVFRCNEGVSLKDIEALQLSIVQYYAAIYSSSKEVMSSGIALPRDYARLALSSGQPNPFPEIYPVEKQNVPVPNLDTRLAERYHNMLIRHHETCGP